MIRRIVMEVNYKRYIDASNEWFIDEGLSLLSVEEESILLAHLKEVVRTFPVGDIGGLDLMSTLCFEASKISVEMRGFVVTPEKTELCMDFLSKKQGRDE